MWNSEDNFVALVLSFHFYMAFRNWTEVSSLAQQMPLPPEPSFTPLLFLKVPLLNIATLGMKLYPLYSKNSSSLWANQTDPLRATESK